MSDNETFKKYLIEEFYDDYREGLISRRTFIRRVAFITGSMAAAATAMLAVGCRPIEVPAASEPLPPPETPAAGEEATAQPAAAPEARSPLSVPEDDPDVQASDVTFASGADEITAYLARCHGDPRAQGCRTFLWARPRPGGRPQHQGGRAGRLRRTRRPHHGRHACP